VFFLFLSFFLPSHAMHPSRNFVITLLWSWFFCSGAYPKAYLFFSLNMHSAQCQNKSALKKKNALPNEKSAGLPTAKAHSNIQSSPWHDLWFVHWKASIFTCNLEVTACLPTLILQTDCPQIIFDRFNNVLISKVPGGVHNVADIGEHAHYPLLPFPPLCRVDINRLEFEKWLCLTFENLKLICQNQFYPYTVDRLKVWIS
jgi:hypothetical protein